MCIRLYSTLDLNHALLRIHITDISLITAQTPTINELVEMIMWNTHYHAVYTGSTLHFI